MRRACTTLFSAILIALITGLGAFAQEPKIAISVPKNFTVTTDGCIVVPAPSNVWAITGGAWAKPEVKAYLTKVNPFLLEPRRQFDWHNMGPGSGIMVFMNDRICGFSSAKVDATLAVTSLSVVDFAKLQAERDAALQKNAAMENLIVLLVGFLALAAVGALLLFLNVQKQKAKTQEARELAEERATQLTAEQEGHAAELRGLHAQHEQAITSLNDEYAQTLVALNKRHEVALAEAVAEVHSLYNPYDGVPVIEGGLPPTSKSATIESVMLREAYRDHAGSNATFLPFEAARTANLCRRVAPITFGYMNGDGVEIRNGDDTHTPKNLRNQPGYHTRIAFPNEREEDAYCLVNCCNPALRGDFIRPGDNFTFTPAPSGSIIAPAPAPILVKELASADGKIQVRITGSASAEAREGDGSLMVIVDRPTGIVRSEN